MQVKNWWTTIVSDEKFEEISPPKKGWMKCYIHCNVTLPHSSTLTVCDNVCRINKRLGLKIFRAIRLPHSYQNWPYQKSKMRASYLFNASQIYDYIVYKCIDYIYTLWFSYVHKWYSHTVYRTRLTITYPPQNAPFKMGILCYICVMFSRNVTLL